MPDFVSNSTMRYRVRYRSAGLTHTMLWRFQDTGIENTPADWADKVSQVLSKLEGLLSSDFSILSAEHAPAGSDVFLPTVAPDVPILSGTNLTGMPAASLSLGFVGRSALGQRARMFVYGIGYDINQSTLSIRDWRITPTEDSHIAQAISTINDLAPECIATDGGVVEWYPYMNMKFNDYWVRKQRA